MKILCVLRSVSAKISIISMKIKTTQVMSREEALRNGKRMSANFAKETAH